MALPGHVSTEDDARDRHVEGETVGIDAREQEVLEDFIRLAVIASARLC
jgi:hypothetical protein